MRTAISIHVVHLRNRLFARLSLPMQIWVRQQAQQIVLLRRFGLWEEMRLNEAIRQKFSQSSPPSSAERAAVTSILSFLVLSGAIASIEEQRNALGEDAELLAVGLQNALDRRSREMQTLSNILKTMEDTLTAIIQNMK